MEKTTGNDVTTFRQDLAAVLKDLRSGSLTPAAANAYANVCGKMLQSVKLELEFNKAVGATPNIGFLSKKTDKLLDSVENVLCNENK